MTIQHDSKPGIPYPKTVPVGMQLLENFIRKHYGGQDLGTLAIPPRPKRGGTTPSLHNWGMAWDWRWIDVSEAEIQAKKITPAQLAAFTDRSMLIANWLVSQAQPLQIQRIHDYFRARAWTPGGGWRKSTAEHMGQSWAKYFHIERNIAGSRDARPIESLITTSPPGVTPVPPAVDPPVTVPPPPASDGDLMAEIKREFPELRQGTNGPYVLILQGLLKAHGRYLEERMDGQFGVNTDRAVESFQSSADLLTDGIVGPKTWSKLLLLGD